MLKLTGIYGENKDMGQIKIKVLDKACKEIPFSNKLDECQPPERGYLSSNFSKSKGLWIVNYENEKTRCFEIHIPKGSTQDVSFVSVNDTNLTRSHRFIRSLEISIENQLFSLSEGNSMLIPDTFGTKPGSKSSDPRIIDIDKLLQKNPISIEEKPLNSDLMMHYSQVLHSLHKNFLPLQVPNGKNLKIVVWELIGHESNLSLEKIHFFDTAGGSLNKMVKKIDFYPRCAFSVFSPADQPKPGVSAIFVNPKKVLEAEREDYTKINIEFNRCVQIGAILFSITKSNIDENPKHVLVYSEGRLMFKGDIMSRTRLKSTSHQDAFAALVFTSASREIMKMIHQPTYKQPDLSPSTPPNTY